MNRIPTASSGYSMLSNLSAVGCDGQSSVCRILKASVMRLGTLQRLVELCDDYKRRNDNFKVTCLNTRFQNFHRMSEKTPETRNIRSGIRISNLGCPEC